MTTDRSYRKAMLLDDAVAELWRSSGTQFDPRVVDALVAPLEDYETGSVVAPPKIELSTT
jgi:HD-GYP domain-containing protein (c-di-GMP phosphodiesterase class II)